MLARYITAKYSPVRRLRDIEKIDVADVLTVYYDDTARGKLTNQSCARQQFGARGYPTLSISRDGAVSRLSGFMRVSGRRFCPAACSSDTETTSVNLARDESARQFA